MKNVLFEHEDALRTGRLSEFDEHHFKALLKKEDNLQTTRELAETIDCTAIRFHLMGLTQKLGGWIPNNLIDENKANRAEKAAQNLVPHPATFTIFTELSFKA